MLPAQYSARVRGRVPQQAEYNLVVALLEDAIHSFQKYRFAKTESARELYTEAREWFESSDRSWPFSFENVCMILGLDPDYVREGLFRSEKAKAEPLEPPRVVDLPLPDLPELDDALIAGVV